MEEVCNISPLVRYSASGATGRVIGRGWRADTPLQRTLPVFKTPSVAISLAQKLYLWGRRSPQHARSARPCNRLSMFISHNGQPHNRPLLCHWLRAPGRAFRLPHRSRYALRSSADSSARPIRGRDRSSRRPSALLCSGQRNELHSWDGVVARCPICRVWSSHAGLHAPHLVFSTDPPELPRDAVKSSTFIIKSCRHHGHGRMSSLSSGSCIC